MINIPKTLCACPSQDSSTILYQISPIETCEESRCSEEVVSELIPILSTLCPCPSEELVLNYNPKPVKTIQSKSCFDSLIKNITSTKFCVSGPSCKAN